MARAVLPGAPSAQSAILGRSVCLARGPLWAAPMRVREPVNQGSQAFADTHTSGSFMCAGLCYSVFPPKLLGRLS